MWIEYLSDVWNNPIAWVCNDGCARVLTCCQTLQHLNPNCGNSIVLTSPLSVLCRAAVCLAFLVPVVSPVSLLNASPTSIIIILYIYPVCTPPTKHASCWCILRFNGAPQTPDFRRLILILPFSIFVLEGRCGGEGAGRLGITGAGEALFATGALILH